MTIMTEVLPGNRIAQWGGAAFALGNVLFLVNKFNEMSRLFLGRSMHDVISGQDPLLILFGQVALIIGYIFFYRFYARQVRRWGKIALGFFSGGGIVLAVGHLTFISWPVESIPPSILPYAEGLFFLVVFGMLFLLIGLIWFGILNLRQPIMSHWRFLPLATGIMGFVGFFLFSGEEINATFLFFRTLFALGLIGLGAALWLEKPVASVSS